MAHLNSGYFAIALLCAAIIGILIATQPWTRQALCNDAFEISEVELGIGTGSITVKPNFEDLQIAYKLWVELRTRKLGLPFDEDHDVITEVYDSWYEFFGVTRELIKSIPVSQIRKNSSTRTLVRIAVDVLNVGVRPHLTQWQARYRRWFEHELSESANHRSSPQEVQKRFPDYAQLSKELRQTNVQLVAYSRILSEIIGMSDKQPNSHGK